MLIKYELHMYTIIRSEICYVASVLGQNFRKWESNKNRTKSTPEKLRCFLWVSEHQRHSCQLDLKISKIMYKICVTYILIFGSYAKQRPIRATYNACKVM